MKNVSIGHTIQGLANLGVVAGIVFRAIELHQNNELMSAQARFNRLSIVTEAFDIQATEPDIAAMLVKDRNNQPLTETEDLRIQSYWIRVFRNLEWLYAELPDVRVWVAGQRRNAAAHSSYRRAWQGNSGGPIGGGKDIFKPEFVEFFEQAILSGE